MSRPPGALGSAGEPRHVAFVTSTSLTVSGGSGTYVGIRELARSLTARGIRIELQAPSFWCPSDPVRRLLFNLAVAPRLRRGGFDWVVGFDLDGFHYGRAALAPYIASIKGVIADELTNERGRVRATLRILAAFERLAVRRADVVVATSDYSRERILAAYGISGRKVVIVPEPIDLEAWEREAGIPSRPEDPPAILSVAHMYPRKNLGTLLQAFARLRDAGVSFRGWLVGEGPCRTAWERLRDALKLEPQVEFLGTISRRELADRYRRAALFCLPSRQEGFGIVFLEAMAFGKPIVALRRAAVPEVVPDGEAGLLLDSEAPEALAEALRELLGDAERRLSMGRAGRRHVERYRAPRVAAAFLANVRDGLAAGLGAGRARAVRAPGGHPGGLPLPGESR